MYKGVGRLGTQSWLLIRNLVCVWRRLPQGNFREVVLNQATSGLSADFYQLDSHRWKDFNPVALYSETINGVDTLFVLDAYHSQVFTYDLATGKRPADGGGGFRIDKVETSGHQRFSGVTLTADEDYFYVSHIQKSESNTITNLVRYLG